MYLKTFNLVLNLRLVQYKAPNLYPVICSKISTVSITIITPQLNEKGIYKFMSSLKTIAFCWKNILQLTVSFVPFTKL